MMGMNTALASFDSGELSIGYNVYYYVSQMTDDDRIKILDLNGVMPSNETIASGEYPLVNDFYAVILSDAPPGSPERKLFDWIQSAEGQDLVKSEGYVPVRP